MGSTDFLRFRQDSYSYVAPMNLMFKTTVGKYKPTAIEKTL